MTRNTRKPWIAGGAALLALSLCAAPARGAFNGVYASDVTGWLFRVDTATPPLTTVIGGPLSPFDFDSTEIAYSNLTGQAWNQNSDGAFMGNLFDINTGLPTGEETDVGQAFNGLEYVGGTLYGVGIPDSGDPSTLSTINTATGSVTPIGLTGIGPISGLAYDGATMYGVTGGILFGGNASLVTIDLGTGGATAVGLTGIDKLGGLAFGLDGTLYAGSAVGSAYGPGNLYSINTGTGLATLVGDTGMANGIHGMTTAVPVPGAALLGMIGLGVAGLKLRKFA